MQLVLPINTITVIEKFSKFNLQLTLNINECLFNNLKQKHSLNVRYCISRPAATVPTRVPLPT